MKHSRRDFFLLLTAALGLRKIAPPSDLSDWSVTIEPGPMLVSDSVLNADALVALNSYADSLMGVECQAVYDAVFHRWCECGEPPFLHMHSDKVAARVNELDGVPERREC